MIAKKKTMKSLWGFESNAQWYLNDKRNCSEQRKSSLRPNSYLFVNYQIDRWTAGVQVEG
jgi:hypothetical protein